MSAVAAQRDARSRRFIYESYWAGRSGRAGWPGVEGWSCWIHEHGKMRRRKVGLRGSRRRARHAEWDLLCGAVSFQQRDRLRMRELDRRLEAEQIGAGGRR